MERIYYNPTETRRRESRLRFSRFVFSHFLPAEGFFPCYTGTRTRSIGRARRDALDIKSSRIYRPRIRERGLVCPGTCRTTMTRGGGGDFSKPRPPRSRGDVGQRVTFRAKKKRIDSVARCPLKFFNMSMRDQLFISSSPRASIDPPLPSSPPGNDSIATCYKHLADGVVWRAVGSSTPSRYSFPSDATLPRENRRKGKRRRSD